MGSGKQLVFDIGMHIGQDTAHYLRSGYDVIAVEASPIMAEAGKARFAKEVEAGRLVILNVGISDRKGKLPFYVNKKISEWSSFDLSLGSRNNTAYDTMPIDCITMSDLLKEYGIPYYVKVDIEGYDFYVIEGLPDEGEKPQYVSCEASEISLLDTMYQKGYRKFKLINQADNFNPIDLSKEVKPWFPKYLNVKNGIELRLQKIMDFKHPYSSSGPFGEEAKGDWMTYEAARTALSTFLRPEVGTPLNGSSWFDIHGSL